MSHTMDILTAQERGELAALCRSRALTYRMLARLFQKELDESYLDVLSAMRYPVSTGNPKVDAGYRAIATYLSGRWENTVEELAIDYARTFLGSGIDAYSAAYPNESVYTSERRLLMQEARDEVRAIYRSEGLEKLSDFAECDDHLGVELEFMGEMAARTAASFEAADDVEGVRLLAVQRHFLEDHLSNWVPMMLEDARKFARTGLYQGLAQLTEGYLANEAELLGELIEED
ncbi:molecular chaperone TorD family protein [Adlercreutzia equolifaciens]|uniref:TorD/DmsD family molecular chaperone n=1 Tax=Adlercreutzia equolifaciens TaxID=446660 RepID=UPI0023AFE4CF|nr:molecular chaperone TorD family protein [Adlercreutzia equolifaciens]MDE8701841.1 molecular chaperone TorD family protein [Adlercreutzia equolifaciens]